MWSSGYRRSLEGTSFPYHSFAPEIRSALLVRGNDERPPIAWETAQVDADDEDGLVRLCWVFAMAASPDAVPFTLFANEAPVLTFTNPTAFDAAGWAHEGRGGASLTFRVTHRDRHGDPMGYALLTLPTAGLPPGRPVRLRLAGENRGSPAWVMVFEHEVEEAFHVDALPRIRRGDDERVQWVRLVGIHLGEPAAVRVGHEGREVARGVLTFGRNVFDVPVPATDTEREAVVEVAVEGRSPRRVAFRQEPIRRWTIHLVQHTHTDIGYTRPQTEILPEHLRFVDVALDLCDATDEVPDDARFRWTCEASWPVREYLRSRPEAQIDRLRRRVREGRVELTALMFNLSELPDEAALLALLEPVRRLAEAGLPVRLAMQNDVNGLAWSLADALPSVGVESFVMGQHGHRALVCFERPTAFWWESPSGTRMLGYRSDHYMTGNQWGLHGTDDDSFQEALFHHLRGLVEAGYPFDRAAVGYGGYLTDNAPPSLAGPAMIRRWNEAWAWPRLRSSTASEFLDWVREAHAGDLAAHRAAWPDWWTDGFASAARETAVARRTHVELVATQALAALGVARGLGMPPDWTRRVQAAYDALLLYDEHTLGAAESISEPDGENAMVQWGEKAAHAWDARRQTRLLGEAALGWLAPSLPVAPEPSVVVLNPLGWTRDGVVEVVVDHEILPPGKACRFEDPTGRDVPAQAVGRREDSTTWAVHVPEVPALGHTCLRIAGASLPASPPRPTPTAVLENTWYALEVDPRTGGLARLFDKELGVDLVDPEAEWGMAAVLHERLGNRHQLERLTLESCERQGLAEVRVEEGVVGPIFESLRIVGRVAASTTAERVAVEFRLFTQSKRIQIACTVHKRAVRTPEGLYVAFPFGVPGGSIRFDVPGGEVRAGRDQLPGSASDWNTVQNHVRVVGDGVEVVLACDAAPLWQLGGLNLGRFRADGAPERPHVYSWVMNNYWVTNFRASQEGEFRWRYDLTSHAPAAPSQATRFGWATRVPLVSRVQPAAPGARGDTTLSLLAHPLPAGLLLVGVRPADAERTLFLHLREVDGRATTIDVATHFAPGRVRRVLDADALGRERGERPSRVAFAPFAVHYLLVELEAGQPG